MEGCSGNPSPSQQSSPPVTLAATVDGAVNQQMQQYGIPGVTLALAKHGPITKEFTAALIMKLLEQGKLHLDDPMANYLPHYGFPSTIRIRMLLNQTSGLADFTNFPQLGQWITNGVSEATVLTAVSQASLQFSPGTQYAYSNSNYFALGSIIEGLTSQPYAASLQQYIFQPLSLSSTYYVLPPAGLSATGYANAGAWLGPVQPWDRSGAFAAGALSSNVYDLVAWDNALIEEEVVSAASFQQMTTPNGLNLDSEDDS